MALVEELRDMDDDAFNEEFNAEIIPSGEGLAAAPQSEVGTATDRPLAAAPNGVSGDDAGSAAPSPLAPWSNGLVQHKDDRDAAAGRPAGQARRTPPSTRRLAFVYCRMLVKVSMCCAMWHCFDSPSSLFARALGVRESVVAARHVSPGGARLSARH